MCENVPFDKVSEVIDRDGRAHPAVTGKNMVYDGSTVILKERKTDKSSALCDVSLLLTAAKVKKCKKTVTTKGGNTINLYHHLNQEPKIL